MCFPLLNLDKPALELILVKNGGFQRLTLVLAQMFWYHIHTIKPAIQPPNHLCQFTQSFLLATAPPCRQGIRFRSLHFIFFN